MLSEQEIKDYFLLVNSHAKKELGQNFLLNEDITKEIANSLSLQKDDSLLEIGPGLGSLTEFLINKTNKFVAVEYDEKFVRHLGMSFKNSNLKIVKNNILKFKDFEFNKICGNLPYYISTDILDYVISNFTNLEIGVFMVQKEFFQRITAKDKKDIRPLNFLLEYAFNLEKILDVNKNNFFPIPKVDSLVFKISKKKIDNNLFFELKKVLNCCFLNRRKTIFNNLKHFSNIIDVNEILKVSNINQNIRAEDLNLKDFLNITENILKVKNNKI